MRVFGDSSAHNKLLLSRFALGLPTLRFGSPKAKR